MALNFDPGSYLQALRYRDERDQRPDPSTITQPLLQSLELMLQNKRQNAMMDLANRKEQRETDAFYSEHGRPVDPNQMIGVGGGELGMPESPKANSRLFGDVKPGTGMPFVDALNRFRARGMKAEDARAEFMPALGMDEKKIFYGNANPKPVSDADIELKLARAEYLRRPPAPQAGSGPNGRQLPPASVLAVNEGKSVARMLPEVEQALVTNAEAFGPLMGRAGQVNPYDTRSQTVDARMRTASQAFGRFMEGGVLRKEDEEKYRKMFPQLSDTPDVAQNKLAIVRRLLAQQYQSQRQSLGDSGYDVSGLGELEVPPSIFDSGNEQGFPGIGANAGGEGLPQIGGTFQGGKVLRVRRIN